MAKMTSGKTRAGSLVQSAICIAFGGLLSVIESGFFPDIGIISLPFLAILAVTVPAVFAYVLSVNSYIFILIYLIALYFVLEISGNSVDTIILLACLLLLVLLFTQARFRQNAGISRAKKPPYGGYLLTVIVCVFIVALSTFQLYIHVLQPALTMGGDFEMPEIAEIINEQDAGTSPDVPQDIREDSDGQYSTIPLRPPRRPEVLTPVMIATAVAFCAFASYVLYRYRRYRKWVGYTLSAPPERQIYEYYMHFLKSLAICGFPRKAGETLFDYLHNHDLEEFPLPADFFSEITCVFAAAEFGMKTVPQSFSDECYSQLRNLPGLVKARMGRKFYYLHYIRKTYAPVRSYQSV